MSGTILLPNKSASAVTLTVGKTKLLLLLLGLVILLALFFIGTPANALVNQEMSFQGKIVDKINGTNISPACVLGGASNDTCDFRLSVYDAPTGGTMLWQEILTDIEIGEYSGVFSLSIGSYCITSQGGSWTSDGDGAGSRCVIGGGGVDWGSDATIYLQIEFDTSNTAGANSFASPEVFSRKLLTSVPFAFHAEEAASLAGFTPDGFVKLAPNAAQASGNTVNTLIRLNEDGSSAPDLIDLQVGGTSEFKVSNDGSSYLGGQLTVAGDIVASVSNNYDLGSATYRFRNGRFSNVDINTLPVAGVSGDIFKISGALNAMDSGDTTRGAYINITNANHTGTNNNLFGLDIGAITGDDEASEYALNIGTGWDRAISAAGTIAFASLANCDTIDTDANGVLTCGSDGGGTNYFTDSGTITYLTSLADDFAIGGTSLAAPFSVDESANTVRIGEGANSNAMLNMYASNAATGSITYDTSDNWLFSGGNIVVTGNLSPNVSGASMLGSDFARWESVYVNNRIDIVDGSSNGGAIITATGDKMILTDAAALILRPGSSGSADILDVRAVPGAGSSGNLIAAGNATLNAMNGTDTVRAFYLNLTNADHTGASNLLYGLDIAAITGDADASEYAINIGSGWDRSISAAGTIAFTGLANCDTIDTDANGILSCGTDAGGAGLFTDGGTVTYLTDTADDFAIGGTSLAAPFSVDESANTVRIGEGANSNGTLSMYASNAATGNLAYLTGDTFEFSGGNIVISDGTNNLWTTGDGGEYGTLYAKVGSSGGTSPMIELVSDNNSGNFTGSMLRIWVDSANTGGFGGDGILIVADTSQVNSSTGALFRVVTDGGGGLFSIAWDGAVNIQDGGFGSGGTVKAITGDQMEFSLFSGYNFVPNNTCAGCSEDLIEVRNTLGAMNGSDLVTGIQVDLVNGNHTGSNNYLIGVDVDSITGDAEALETAFHSGTGWDAGGIFETGVMIGDVAVPATMLSVKAASATVATFNRTTNDGTIIDLQQDGTSEGTISVAGNTMSYNPFTGSHYAWLEEQGVERGMVVSMTGNNKYHHDNKDSEILYGVTLSRVENDPRVLGTYLAREESAEEPGVDNPELIAAVGNGNMWIVNKTGKDINPGDLLITSGIPGYAMLDNGNYSKTHVIARAAEAVKWADVDDMLDGMKRTNISVLYDNYTLERTSELGGFTSLGVEEYRYALVVLALLVIALLGERLSVYIRSWAPRLRRK